MRVLAIIPARFASSRLPGKPLLKIGEWSVVRHVYERVTQLLPDAVVATDDDRIYAEVMGFGGRVVMTLSSHKSGTDRIREALDKVEAEEGVKYDIAINVQGDEPFVSLGHLRLLIDAFTDSTVDIATLIHPYPYGASMEQLSNPNQVKVVRAASGKALYFSRSVVPYQRNADAVITYYRHIGLYAFRSNVLREVTELPVGTLEQVEGLEQLRWLEAGYKIQTAITGEVSIGIDTEDDLEEARRFYETHYR